MNQGVQAIDIYKKKKKIILILRTFQYAMIPNSKHINNPKNT